MPGFSATVKAALGNRGGAGGNTMYGSTSAAPPHVITGELWVLLLFELLALGVIRFTFLHHLGG